MRSIRLVFPVVLVVAAIAAGATPSPTPSDAAARSLAGLSGKAFDIAFMQVMIPRHEEAVEIALAATLNADHPELLKWNQRMIERKNAQTRQMLAWLTEQGASPTRRMAGVVTDPVKRMRALKGVGLERIYLPLMAARLREMAALGRLAAARAERPGLRVLGADIARVETQEAAMLKGWALAWYGLKIP